MTDANVSQLATEVVQVNDDPYAQVSQLAVEALRLSPTAYGQVSQLAVEILRINQPDPTSIPTGAILLVGI